MNPVKALQQFGQSIWLDYIRRNLITGRELERLIREKGLRGVIGNSAIFQKAIAGSSDYDDSLAELLRINPHEKAEALFEKLAVADIQMTADVLRPVYEETEGKDGYVSLELHPRHDCSTEEGVEEAKRIWGVVNRPNIMINIPANPEGIPVVETLVAAGINVNITHVFSMSHFEAAVNAYMKGLEDCEAPGRVASVASFLVSRVDTKVDKVLESVGTHQALKIRGRAAVANARAAYARFREIFRGERWKCLAEKGARVLRPLWISTGTKNPLYSDVLYVEELAAPETIIAVPPATLNAFWDHGRVRPFLQEEIQEAREVLRQLRVLGIDIHEILEKLQAESMAAFSESYKAILRTLEEKRSAILHGKKDRQVIGLSSYQSWMNKRLAFWKKTNFIRRFHAKDPTLWFSKPVSEITDRLGWMILPEIMQEHVDSLVSFAEKIRNEGVTHVVLLGMGGSSLAPEVFHKIFGASPGYPELVVLDTTHPDAVLSLEESLDLSRTLFLVSSKSGTTLETLSLFRYFWEKAARENDNPGKQFMAVTDAGTPLMKIARERNFSRIFLAPHDVGGRFSALTFFGLVPAAVIGMNVSRLLDRAWMASENSSFCVPEDKSSGLILGAALGEVARDRDKLTLYSSPGIQSFSGWLEQLVAESTGKDNRGIIPIVDEPFIPVNHYGKDRIFVGSFLDGDRNEDLEKQITDLEKEGHPVVRINLADKYDLGQEIFRWEIAVASAGAALGIHPFNQPDVQLAKELTSMEMEKEKEKGTQNEDGVETVSVENTERLAEKIRGWMGRAKKGDYVALQAYLPPAKEVKEALQRIRLGFLKHIPLATTLGFGPRFLHSTGQLHKGGANKGLFLQIVDEPRTDLSIPETDYTFGSLIRAQALGDLRALKQKRRRVLRVNLRRDVRGGLEQIRELISRA